jgi:ribosomal protein S18 acetylase RimI-like enzyme
MGDTTIVRWDGDLRVAADVLTRGFADYAVPQRESPEDLRRQVEDGYVDPARSFLAFDAGVAVGGSFAAVRPDGRARLHALVVDPGWRRRGIGRALLHATRDALSAAGCDEIVTEALADNRGALGLYAAAGFHAARRLSCLRGMPPACSPAGLEVRPDAVGRLPRVVQPLHRDRIALERMPGVRVAIDGRGGWIAWRGAVLLDLVADDADADALLAWLPRECCKIIDVPEDDPLLSILRARGWIDYATQVELRAADRVAGVAGNCA